MARNPFTPVSTHSRPKAAGVSIGRNRVSKLVSTHSRPKAAGAATTAYTQISKPFQHTAARRRLGQKHLIGRLYEKLFQHTAARRRLGPFWVSDELGDSVSTHSRPKAAGKSSSGWYKTTVVSTHSRPKAAGTVFAAPQIDEEVSTHSRPKAAGTTTRAENRAAPSFNTQPPEGGWQCVEVFGFGVILSFNTQPPEGGWSIKTAAPYSSTMFQHTAARRRLGL